MMTESQLGTLYAKTYINMAVARTSKTDEDTMRTSFWLKREYERDSKEVEPVFRSSACFCATRNSSMRPL